jgi:penicillin-binding protein 1A
MTRPPRRPFNHKFARLLAFALGALALVLAVVSIAAVALYQKERSSSDWPHVTQLETERIGQNSVVYSADGKQIGTVAAPENRRQLPLKDMGEYLPEALVAIEDRRFYSHDGVDRRGIARAMWRNIKARGYVEGASTIDQQLVRNLYPEIDNDRTLTRKMKEASLAQELNALWRKKYGREAAKKRILALYLNLVFFGNNAYGADAASRTYFGKTAANLQVQEAALIAGLVQSPTAYDPFKHPEAALARRNEVLEAMERSGKITKAELTQAKATPLGVKRGTKLGAQASPAPYFFDYVRREAEDAYGKDTVQRGGLRIYTTLDTKMQKLAEQSIASVLNQPGDPASALVVIENRSGAIRAMASSERYANTQFNFAADAKRQPGSAAKTWALAALLQGGVDPDQVRYLSTPLAIRPGPGKAIWKPQTYDGSYAGLISVRDATVRSDNSVFAQITLDIGPERVAETAHRMGIQSKLQSVESIGLGSQVVTPLELTRLYSTIARGGVNVEPYALRQVTSASGSRSERAKPKVERALEAWQAEKIISILSDNVKRGTGTAAQLADRPVAGKTGTTDDYKDAWFCGMTPTHTACVWVGYPKPRSMTNVHGISVAGGTLPAQIWQRFMSQALSKVKPGEFVSAKEPSGLKQYVPGWCNRAGIEVIQGPRNIRCSSTSEDNIKPKG